MCFLLIQRLLKQHKYKTVKKVWPFSQKPAPAAIVTDRIHRELRARHCAESFTANTSFKSYQFSRKKAELLSPLGVCVHMCVCVCVYGWIYIYVYMRKLSLRKDD